MYIYIYVDGVLFIFRMTWDWALNPPSNPHISPAKNPYNPSLVPSARYPAIMNTPPPNVEYIVACLPAPPPPPQWYGIGTRSHCHFAASRPACLRRQADPSALLWFGGLAFFHDCQVIQVFAPPPLWCSGCAFSQNCQPSLLLKPFRPPPSP